MIYNRSYSKLILLKSPNSALQSSIIVSNKENRVPDSLRYIFKQTKKSILKSRTFHYTHEDIGSKKFRHRLITIDAFLVVT